MKTEKFNCKFYDVAFTLIITSEYPKILKVESNLRYKLRENNNELKPNEQEFTTYTNQGKSNHKEYKQYTDRKGEYIKYITGAGIKPNYVKIYKDVE